MSITHSAAWRSKDSTAKLPKIVVRARRRFLKHFPGGFQDPAYLERERNPKWEAHEFWQDRLSDEPFRTRLALEDFSTIVSDAIRIESYANLLQSLEKQALRDAVRTPDDARLFATGLYDWLYGIGEDPVRFERWIGMLAALPRRLRRVLTWPVTTVFGFIARPYVHMFLKPMVTRRAAVDYGFNLDYRAIPNWETYVSLLEFARRVKRENRDLGPRDMIDIDAFIRVQGDG